MLLLPPVCEGRNLQSNNRADRTITVYICPAVEEIICYLSTVDHYYMRAKRSSVENITCRVVESMASS